NIMKYLFQTLTIIVALGCARALSAAEEDPVKLAPDMYRMILQNRQVRVVEAAIKPGATVPMHEHPDSVIYVIKGGRVRFTDEKGRSKDVELKNGEVQFRDHEEHAVQNIGKNEIRVLHVELH
ncbi:MAG TPA: cupin domain-containing protein, partial [Chthoniobacterales bacterium]|nr:cupin domain-containing protein [Chthoniobacterales bacterium]